MTKFIPHVSLVTFLGFVILALQYAQNSAQAWEAWGASAIPLTLGIVTTIQQMAQSKSVSIQQLLDMGSRVQQLESGFKQVLSANPLPKPAPAPQPAPSSTVQKTS